MRTRVFPSLFPVLAAALVVLCPTAEAKKQPEVPLTARGTELHQQYTKQLESLRAEVVAALPKVDEGKKAAFLEARTQWNSLKAPGEGSKPQAQKDYETGKEEAKAAGMAAAGELLTDLKPLLSSDALDGKLMRIAILSHGTPRGLAEFAQQGPDKEKLVETLFADEELMRQILEAGGANGGEYGEMMEVYTAILEASERARERGTIFQRLALGMAIQMPWLNDRDRGAVYGIVFNANSNIEQVPRYLHYEKAYLDGELDPAFPKMNTWECRYIANDPYSNEDLAWFRQMLRTYRPDHITTDDYKWR